MAAHVPFWLWRMAAMTVQVGDVFSSLDSDNETQGKMKKEKFVLSEAK